MSPFCFWSRRACSHYAVLGEPIPPGSRLQAHMERCPGCRDYWSGLNLLATDLETLISVPRPTYAFAEPIWDRVRPIQRSRRWEALTLVGVTASGLICGWLVWRTTAFRSNTDQSPDFRTIGRMKPGLTALAEGPKQEDPEVVRLPVTEAGSLPIKRSTGTRAITWASLREDSHPRRRVPSRRILPELLAPKLQTPESPADLQAAGMMFEAQGDPSLAKVAYESAYEANPSDQTAFDIGRTAEESGDMDQAMEIYAGLLAAADTNSRNEKGWKP